MESITVTWADARLSQAFELVDAVLAEHNNPETEAFQMLRLALDGIENADVEIEREQPAKPLKLKG